MSFAMCKQAEGSIFRGCKGNMCTKCLGSYTGTSGQHMRKSTSSNNTSDGCTKPTFCIAPQTDFEIICTLRCMLHQLPNY